ncbi:exopolyphosphatase [Rhodococcus sp. Leaf278]|uniref:acyclic terpene utilization AtuA family protein n=1 Tax=Rhodococcus sp. Leaf278 TaxID=1736319 RepID=UPI0007097A11|nr:acyclic terpene utilization AtuA family protein [Rhodococcus sp. Leaf278]KQU45892.1 exopolyphosphatase [Rhodococcus sp. Leaf278]
MNPETAQRRPVRIGNASGFYGDRIAAFREMVDGGPIDVVTGDYLAELTMLILWKARKKDPDSGYAKTFLTQMKQVLADCIDKNIKIVVNAGGLNPSGLAEKVRELATELDVDVKVAHVEGDDLHPRLIGLQEAGHPLRHLDSGVALADADVEPVSANVYLGGWGIAAALRTGADIVICPRVTDASLVVGASAWWHGWKRDDFDALAGSVLAGHIIECGPQVTGGNYSQINEVVDRRYPGFPIAEIAHDGSFVITKHPDTGGLVSVGTVTAQLLYEVDHPHYLNPDVVAHFDTARVEQEDENRVLVSNVVGTPPPTSLKVAMNYVGGFRNTMTMVLTGLDIEEKAAWATEELFEILGGRKVFDEADVQLLRFDSIDPATAAQASAHLRVTVKDRDRSKVDRAFSGAVMELALGGYAGFHTTTPPSSATEFGVYWPTLIPSSEVEHVVVHHDGSRETIPHTAGVAAARTEPASDAPTHDDGNRPVTRRPIGHVVAARSGDKGGKANVGVWTDSDERWSWLRSHLTVDRFVELVPEATGLNISRYEFANLRALNFVVDRFLGDGVASSTRPDAQAKGLGEYLRARHTEVPDELVDG